jgi:leucyl-tRNA synthetase
MAVGTRSWRRRCCAGNFKTLQEAIAEYSADAMRIALADAGDAMDDANFEESVANATIMRLTRELAFIDEVLAAAKADQLRSPTSDYFVDR